MPERFAKADASPNSGPSTAFNVTVAARVFEKASAPEGKRHRIGGIATTESLDRQGEIVLQRGLDWSFFKAAGVINENHGKKIEDVVGVPEDVKFFTRGTMLPDGTRAPADGHWLECYLLEGDPKADAIWAKARILEKTGDRSLGFSIEGDVLARAGANNKIVAQALVRHTAVTHCPVNQDSGFSRLVKSLEAVEAAAPGSTELSGAGPTSIDSIDRALTAASASGAAIQPEDLEGTRAKACNPRCSNAACKGCAAMRKSLSKAEGIYYLGVRYPHMPFKSLEKLYDTATRISRETARI